jgi:magnesium transporter
MSEPCHKISLLILFVAEWIAHGLLDSIVDAFFPLISHIDDEVDEIDTLVIDPSNTSKKEKPKPEHLPLEALNVNSGKVEVIELQEKEDVTGGFPKPKLKKKKRRPLSKRIRRGWKQLRRGTSRRHARLQLWFDQSHLGMATNAAILYLRRTFGGRHSNRLDSSTAFQPIFDRTYLLHRMTEMRRLVTGLTRLLGAKHQVVTRLRKRAALGGGEVGVYISDVQGKPSPTTSACTKLRSRTRSHHYVADISAPLRVYLVTLPAGIYGSPAGHIRHRA